MANQNQNNDNNDDEKKDAGGNEGENQQGNNGGSQGNGGNDGQNQNGGGTNNSGGGSDGGNGGNQSQGKTFSQEDVNRMMAKEKQQGRNAVFNELGINPDDADAISLIKALMAAKGANEGDGGNQGDNSAELAQAQERARIAEMKADAMKAGVKVQYVDDAVDLVRARYSDENNDFNAILNELKSKYAIWFEDTEEDDKGGAGKRGTGSTISSKNQQGSKNNQSDGLGKRLAGLRKPQTKKSSYFSS